LKIGERLTALSNSDECIRTYEVEGLSVVVIAMFLAQLDSPREVSHGACTVAKLELVSASVKIV
jgi:hypothetical protein